MNNAATTTEETTMTTQTRTGYYLAPASNPTDEYAAGYEGNVFDTAEEAEEAIPGLRALGGDMDCEWVVSRYPQQA